MQGETNTRRLKVPNRPGIYTRTRIGVNGKPELVYEYEYRDADKRQHFASAEGGVMAAVSAREAKRSEVRAEKTERKLGAPARATSMPPFGDRARKYLLRKEATVADSTYEEYEREVRLHLLPLWEHKPMSAVTTDAVLELLVKLKRDGYSEHKRASILARLGGIFRQTLADPACRGLPIVNPVDGLEQSERPKPTTRDNIVTLNPTEVAALIAAAPVRYRAAVAILPYAGLRIAEAMGLLIEDVDFAKNRIHVRHQRARKGTGIIDRTKTSAGTREVAMTPELAALIRHHIDKYAWTKEPTAPLFQTRNGTPLSIRNFRRSGFTKAI
jgi:integrase